MTDIDGDVDDPDDRSHERAQQDVATSDVILARGRGPVRPRATART